MFPDPTSVTINSVAKSMPRVFNDGLSSEYKTSDGLYQLDISHQETGASRIRTLVKLTTKKVAADPLTAVNTNVSDTVQITFDRPAFGFTDVDLYQQLQGLAGLLTQANVTKLYGFES